MMQKASMADHAGGDGGGFALPAAILALVAVGLFITGGIQLALRRPPDTLSTQLSRTAFYVAESGLNRVLASWRPGDELLRPWGPADQRSGSTPEGEWTASVRRVGDRLYFVRAVGRAEGAGGSSARRALGTVARLESPEVGAPAALRTSGTVRLAAGADVRGEDAAPAAWGSEYCPDALRDVPALLAPADGWVGLDSAAGARSEWSAAQVRDPDLAPEEFEGFGELDWTELVARATVHLPGGTLEDVGPRATGGVCDVDDPMNWGDPLDPAGPCGDRFPIIHVDRDATIRSNGSGQGILFVDGNLTVTGGFQFFGLVIVRGAISLEGGGGNAPSVFGAVSTGDVGRATQRLTGPVLVQNSSCAIRRAVKSNPALMRLRPLVKRGWVDLTDASL